MTTLEREAMEIVRDMVRVMGSPDAGFAEDGVDERLFAARIEGLVLRELEATDVDREWEDLERANHGWGT